eukprot:m.49913 g.49913  ORF g.49913 m.49913 type:complete len:1251 (+) comp34044_c0_seq1:332-4084(+)
MASSPNNFNYDNDFDDDFENEVGDFGEIEGGGGSGDREGEGSGNEWDGDEDNTDEFIDSIREQLGKAGEATDDSLIGEVDLDLDSELGDYLKEIEKDGSSAEDGRNSVNESPGDSLSRELRGDLSLSKDIDLAAYGVLTDGDGFQLDDLGLDLDDFGQDSEVNKVRKTTVVVGGASPGIGSSSDISQLSGQLRMAGKEESQLGFSLSLKHQLGNISKSQGSLGSGDVLSQLNGSGSAADDKVAATSTVDGQKSDSSELERLAEEAAAAQAAIEDKLIGKLSDMTHKTPSPSQRSQRSGRLSGSSLGEMSAVEKRWSFKPVLTEFENGRNKSPLTGMLSESLGRQVEESERQLKKTVESIQGAATELMDITQKKEVTQREVQLLQRTLAQNKGELKRVEDELKQCQSACTERRNETNVLNRKRDYVKSELNKLEMILGEKRSFREGSPLSPSNSKAAEEYLKVLQESTHLRAELDGARSKLKTDLPLKQREIDELKKQLKAASEDLFGEKKRSRERYDRLKEEYDNGQKQLREVLRDKMSAIGKVKDKAESQKTADLEVLKQRLTREKEGEVERLKEKLTKQMEELKRTVQTKDKELQKANSKWRERSEAASALSTELKEMSKQMSEKDALAAKAEKKHLFQIEDVQKAIALKEGEMKHLKTTLKQQEESAKSLGQKLRAEAQEQVRKAVERQKQAQEKSLEQELRRERETMKEDSERSIAELKETVSKEQQKAKVHQAMITSLREEIEEQKQIAKQAHRDKLKAIGKAKDLIRKSRREEIDKVTDKMQLEHRNALEKFKEKVRRLEEEVRQTKESERFAQQKDRDIQAKSELLEKTLVMDINEECRKTNSFVTSFSMAASQGRRSRPGTPRPATPRLGSSSDRPERPSSAPAGGSQRRELASTPRAALIQLRSACEELRRQCSELKGELDKERQTVSQLHRDKVAELKRIKEEIMEEKSAEMTSFKEKVLKELAAGKASLQKQAAKGVEIKLQRHLKEKNEEIRELRKEIQQRKEEDNQRLVSKAQEETYQEIEKRAKEQIRRLDIQQKAERAVHQREIEKLERELKKLAQEAASSSAAAAVAAAAAAAAGTTATASAASASSKPISPATTTDAAKARAALHLARGLQRKMKQMQMENEQLKADLRKGSQALSSVGDNHHPHHQPRDNSAETHDSGLSSMTCDASPAPNELQQLQHEVKLSERKVHRAGVLLNERTKEVTRLQCQLKQLNKEYLILQKQHGSTLERLGEE